MTIDDDVEAFRVWATKLGCVPDSMPCEDALKSVFKSRQRDLFCNLMQRVRSRQEVRDITENILIQKIEKIKGHVVSVSERSFLPQEMQTHLRVGDLKKKHVDMKQLLEERKKDYEVLEASIKTKSIQIANLENKCELLEAKVHLLDFKTKSFDKHLKREEDNLEKIKATMPVLLTNENKSEKRASEAVLMALKELEIFYALCEKDNNYQALQEAKSNLWSNMRQIFTNIPNFLILNTIMQLKEEQLQHIMSLNRTINNDSHLNSNSREPLSNFEIHFLKTSASLVGLVGKYLAACQERSNFEMKFANTYEDFEEKLFEKVKIFNGDLETERSEDIMRNFVVEYNFLNFTKGQNEYLSQQIEILKSEIESAQKYLENHEVLLGSIKHLNSEISASINRIQYDMMQLSQIKDKIIYSKNIMKHQLDDLEANVANNSLVKSNFKPTKLKITHGNMSLVGLDSFEMTNDNVFCSTKLDLDSTMGCLNNTTLQRSFSGAGDMTMLPPQSQNTILPSHTLELATFCETPLEHLSCLQKESSFYLSPNPLITESRELSSTVQLAPGVLLTSFGALQEVRNRVLWADLIAQHSNDLKLNLDTFLVDPQQFKQKAKQQHDRIIEILDKTDVCSINTIHSLQKLAKLYDFLIENPLRHFIPTSKCFNNQSYADYEAELTMYARMATTGNSIK